MTHRLESDYVQRETHYVHILDEATALGRLRSVGNECLLEILQQRRVIAMQFTPFCDAIMCALEDEQSRSIVADLVRLEYVEENHRDLFVQELMKVRTAMGVPNTRRDVVTHATTAATNDTVVAILKLAEDAARAPHDLARLVVLRFFGEVTPGHEFKKLSFALDHLELLKREDQVFLYPHVEFDELGKSSGTDQSGETHAAQYLAGIGDRLETATDFELADQWLDRAIRIRHRFYEQFDVSAAAI